MTQTADLIHKMAEFFKSEEFFEKGEDAKLELSPDDVRCMNEIIKACGNGISRQTVLDTISELNAISFYEAQEDSRETYYEIRQAIKDLSPVKQEPKTGHWIYDRTRDWDGECKYECSECGMGSDVDYPFCMRCGAKMVEPQESEE